MAHAYGLEELKLPPGVYPIVLSTRTQVETHLSSLLDPIDIDADASLVVGFDAEWNVSRNLGVSVIQLAPEACSWIFVIPVRSLTLGYLSVGLLMNRKFFSCIQVCKFNTLPPALVRVLVSPRVYKVGSMIKQDIGRLRRQFPQLGLETGTLNLIDLRELCIRQGVIKRGQPGSLEALLKTTTKKYIPKDDALRRCDDWETYPLRQDLLNYAALDAYASRVVYEEAQRRTPPVLIDANSPPGTRITLYTQADGGFPAAHGTISDPQPSSFNGIRVKTPSCSRVLIDIDHVIMPSAAATLHTVPDRHTSRNKAGTYTLRELQDMSVRMHGMKFQVVAPVSHLCPFEEPHSTADVPPHNSATPAIGPVHQDRDGAGQGMTVVTMMEPEDESEEQEESQDEIDRRELLGVVEDIPEIALDMLEAFSAERGMYF